MAEKILFAIVTSVPLVFLTWAAAAWFYELHESSLADPKNPQQIVMKSGNSYYIFPGGYSRIPRELLEDIR